MCSYCFLVRFGLQGGRPFFFLGGGVGVAARSVDRVLGGVAARSVDRMLSLCFDCVWFWLFPVLVFGAGFGF